MTTVLAGFAISAPSSAPTAAVGTATGLLDNAAAYGYKVTYVTAFGETDPSSAATVTTTSTRSVNLTAIPVSQDGNVTGRKIYRTVGGGSSYLLLATLDDNTTTTYADIAADDDLGAAAPTLNSAHSIETVNGILKATKPVLRSVATAIVATGTVIGDAYQLSAEYNFIGTAAVGTGVRLPELATGLIGMHVAVRNNGANTLKVYPYTAQTIAGGGAGASVNLAAGATAGFVADSAGNWGQI